MTLALYSIQKPPIALVYAGAFLYFVDRIEKKIVLIDGEQLTQLMIEYNVGIAVEESYIVKKVDLDYFEEA